MTDMAGTPAADGAIRVVLADDQALIRAGFRVLLDGAPDITVVAEAGDGAEAVALARALRPDVVIMDIRMPVLDGLAATRQITADPDLAATRLLILTTFELDEYVFEALRAGASGFLGKGMDPAGLADAVRTVAEGGSLLSPRATTGLVEHFLAQPVRGDAPVKASLGRLTGREQEIVALAAEGLSNDDIAGRLHLSPLTVKTHANRAMAKVGARDRAQLVVFAYQSGLVVPGRA
ncbi:response regulator transcription factor [Sinomonas mesophila]|uniref:response regulator transcription factor n=1 Tax=Sinomonas mesophila TaxID=1531955 RepID=UPI001FE58DA1|nr:response regulator transcription factor [Sinomonas mesophila]